MVDKFFINLKKQILHRTANIFFDDIISSRTLETGDVRRRLALFLSFNKKTSQKFLIYLNNNNLAELKNHHIVFSKDMLKYQKR